MAGVVEHPSDEAVTERQGDTAPLMVDIDGYEGPLDVLLALARTQKVDLTRLSILQLAEQYLAFIEEVRRLSLEVAADYLVMAAWLAYLKSRLLLPESTEGDDPSAADMAERLAFQLRRLDAIREAGGRLMARHWLGRDVFARGDPQEVEIVKTPVYDVALYDLLTAYAKQRVRAASATLRIAPRAVYRIEDALHRLGEMIGQVLDWEVLERFLPPEMATGFARRSALAATFAASLELSRTGEIELSQSTPFGPIYVRPKRPAR